LNKEDREKFKKFGELVKALEGNVVPDSHWEKEAEILRNRMNENKRINNAITMSPKKFREPFTI